MANASERLRRHLRELPLVGVAVCFMGIMGCTGDDTSGEAKEDDRSNHGALPNPTPGETPESLTAAPAMRSVDDLTLVHSPSQDHVQRVTLEEVGILATFGANDNLDAFAVFHKPLDAAISDEYVIILDATPPWIRVFEKGGRFVRAVSASGGGPGEALRPTSVDVTVDGKLLLGHATGLEVLSLDGKSLSSMRGERVLGAAAICEGDVALLLQTTAEIAGTVAGSALVFVRTAGAQSDTVASWSRVRSHSRNYHPWLVLSGPNRLLIYSEEESRNVLLEYTCDGMAGRTVTLGSLGEPEAFRRTERGFSIRGPTPPLPAGLVRLGNRTLWATRIVHQERDSLTVLSFVDEEPSGRDIALEGWYQVLAADLAGRVLVTNTWTHGQNWLSPGVTGLVPMAFLVDGYALARLMGVTMPLAETPR